MLEPFSHFVFVDFENVPSIDLALIDGKEVHVTLLIGEKQKRLDLPLVRQIHRHAHQVTLIEVGASGRNALDLVLAAYLGQAMQSHPNATFTIISRDHDFDPLVMHFRANGARVNREPDFSALPIFGRPDGAAMGARNPAATAKSVPTLGKPSAAASSQKGTRQKKMDGLVARLRARTNRPKTRDSLLHHINTVFGQKLSKAEQEAIFKELLELGIFSASDGKTLVYS